MILDISVRNLQDDIEWLAGGSGVLASLAVGPGGLLILEILVKVSSLEDHGLRCLMHLAEAYERHRTATIAEIAAARGMTPAYVAKVVSILRRGGLVRTTRGSRGGLRLTRAPESITLAEAIEVLTGTRRRLHPCVEQDHRRDCGWTDACGLRQVWRDLDTTIQTVLNRETLKSLVSAERAEGDATSLSP